MGNSHINTRWYPRNNHKPISSVLVDKIPDFEIQWSSLILHTYTIEIKKVENLVHWSYLLVNIQVRSLLGSIYPTIDPRVATSPSSTEKCYNLYAILYGPYNIVLIIIWYMFALECLNGHHQYPSTGSTKASFDSDAGKIDDSVENFKPVFSES